MGGGIVMQIGGDLCNIYKNSIFLCIKNIYMVYVFFPYEQNSTEHKSISFFLSVLEKAYLSRV